MGPCNTYTYFYIHIYIYNKHTHTHIYVYTHIKVCIQEIRDRDLVSERARDSLDPKAEPRTEACLQLLYRKLRHCNCISAACCKLEE